MSTDDELFHGIDPASSPDLHQTQVMHIPTKAEEAARITVGVIQSAERELAERQRIAGDTAPRLMYELADAVPTAVDAFVLFHAQQLDRRVDGDSCASVAAVFLRHMFLVGAMSARRSIGA